MGRTKQAGKRKQSKQSKQGKQTKQISSKPKPANANLNLAKQQEVCIQDLAFLKAAMKDITNELRDLRTTTATEFKESLESSMVHCIKEQSIELTANIRDLMFAMETAHATFKKQRELLKDQGAATARRFKTLLRNSKPLWMDCRAPLRAA